MHGSTTFQYGDGTFFFVSGDAPLQAPEAYVQRSPVLVDIYQQGGSLRSTVLPISDACIRAWHRCVHVLLHTPEKLATRYSDEELVKALKAAHFLRDEDSAEAITRVLSLVLVPEEIRVSSIGTLMKVPELKQWVPTEEQRERCCKIIKEIPVQLFLNILKAIQPGMMSEQLFDCSSEDQHNAIMLYLFLLLPASCHAAILYTLRESISAEGFLHVPAMPYYYTMDGSCHSRATPTVCMLAAACAFSDGSPVRIWQPDLDPLPDLFHQFPTHGFPLTMLGVIRKKDVHFKRPRSDEPELAHDESLVIPVDTSVQLTKLSLDLTVSSPTQWCAAVRQLHTLRHLRTSFRKLERANPTALAHMLLHMPHLERFEVDLVPRPTENMCTKVRQVKQTPDVKAPAFSQLLAAFAKAPTLPALALIRCFSTEDHGPRNALALDHLSSMTWLTQLSLRGCAIGQHWVGAFAGVFVQLRHIVELNLSDTGDGAEAVVRARLAGGLPAIQHLDLSLSSSFWLCTVTVDDPQSRPFHGLKSLNLAAVDVGDVQADRLAAVLHDLQQLELLNLAHIWLTNDGLLCIASVLRGLTSLTNLNLGYNSCTSEGVTAILEAAGQIRIRGPGLRVLNMPDGSVGASEVPEVGECMASLEELQELNVSGLLVEVNESWDWQGQVFERLGDLTKLTVGTNPIQIGSNDTFSPVLCELTEVDDGMVHVVDRTKVVNWKQAFNP